MRLLHARTLELEEFASEDDLPAYAILSHTWDSDEVFFKDIDEQTYFQKKEGFRKINGCARRALQNGLEWIWIDTCCIDKSSSAELSEAINSMYKWYSKSSICYAYLSDVYEDYGRPRVKDADAMWPFQLDYDEIEAVDSQFVRSRWFTRGWTLQELIAPPKVIFFNAHWQPIAARSSRQGRCNTGDNKLIARITGIDLAVLESVEDLQHLSVAERMSWASKRQTTRPEDEAYCLMGIFGVNMPLLYGEGRAAFRRLQEEILKASEDETILAWSGPTSEFGALASSTECFTHSAEYKHYFPWAGLSKPSKSGKRDLVGFVKFESTRTEFIDRGFQPWTMTARGLQCSLPLLTYPDFPWTSYALLRCWTKQGKQLVIPLQRLHGNIFSRPLISKPIEFETFTWPRPSQLPNGGRSEGTIFIFSDKDATAALRDSRRPQWHLLDKLNTTCRVSVTLDFRALKYLGWDLSEVYPEDALKTESVHASSGSNTLLPRLGLHICQADSMSVAWGFRDGQGERIYLLVSIQGLGNISKQNSGPRQVCWGFYRTRSKYLLHDLTHHDKLPDLSPSTITDLCSSTIQVGIKHVMCVRDHRAESLVSWSSPGEAPVFSIALRLKRDAGMDQALLTRMARLLVDWMEVEAEAAELALR